MSHSPSEGQRLPVDDCFVKIKIGISSFYLLRYVNTMKKVTFLALKLWIRVKVKYSQQKTKLCMSAHNACFKQTKYSQIQLLKCHHYNIETRRYSSAINLNMRVHLTEMHVSFCLVGTHVGIEVYDIIL